jgi:hypothetical protein
MLKIMPALVFLAAALCGCVHFTSGDISDDNWKELLNRQPFDFAVATNDSKMYATLMETRLFTEVYHVRSLEDGKSLNETLADESLVVFKPRGKAPTERPALYFAGPSAESILDWSTVAFFPYNFLVCIPNLFTAGLVLPQYVSHTYEQEIKVMDADGNEQAVYDADFSEYWLGWFMYLYSDVKDDPSILGGTERQIVEQFLEDCDAGKFGHLIAGPEYDNLDGGFMKVEQSEKPVEPDEPLQPEEPTEPEEPMEPEQPDEPSVDPEEPGSMPDPDEPDNP